MKSQWVSRMIDLHHISALSKMIDPKGVTTNPDELDPFVTEWRDKFIGSTPLMLAPRNTNEAAAIVKYCYKNRIPIVPQGGNTGLVGGGIPGLEGSHEILLSTRRMNARPIVNASDFTLVTQAGCTVSALQEAAAQEQRLFGLALASEGSCTAGGIAATNAGGVHVIRYGTTRSMIIGVEAVLPDGTIINELSGLRKNNTGYPLSQLLIGAEGTLGFITKVCFRLFPQELSRATAWLAVPSPRAALVLLSKAREISEDQVSVFELMNRSALEFTCRHIPGTRDPLTDISPWYVLIETASSAKESAVEDRMQSLLENSLKEGLITDGAVAQSLDQRALFWRNRESISEAQKLEGGSIKHDISVPLGQIAAFISSTTDALEKTFPDVRVTPFGHLGDGNLHFNVMQPENGDKTAFLNKWEPMNRLVHDHVIACGGSISAEHGIGVLKKAELMRTKPPAELSAMKAIKKALDPHNIMNPRCLFD